jgi:hypothetical protein
MKTKFSIINFQLSILLALLITLTGCSSDNNNNNNGDDPLPEIELDVEPATGYFTYVANTIDVEVYCNDAWTATVDAAAAAWCSVSPASGSGDGFLAITVTANLIPTQGVRTATVTITADDVTKTVAVTQEVILTTLCEACLWDATAAEGAGTWVDGYVTTNDYPFDEAGDFIGQPWNGVEWGDWRYYEGAVSDRDGRANTAAIESTGESAVQTCKDLGEGWYLPAYEELYNISAGNATFAAGMAGQPPLNGRSGKNLLTTAGEEYYWSSTEFLNHTGRYSLTERAGMSPEAAAIYVNHNGDVVCDWKTSVCPFRCVWRPE